MQIFPNNVSWFWCSLNMKLLPWNQLITSLILSLSTSIDNPLIESIHKIPISFAFIQKTYHVWLLLKHYKSCVCSAIVSKCGVGLDLVFDFLNSGLGFDIFILSFLNLRIWLNSFEEFIERWRIAIALSYQLIKLFMVISEWNLMNIQLLVNIVIVAENVINSFSKFFLRNCLWQISDHDWEERRSLAWLINIELQLLEIIWK